MNSKSVLPLLVSVLVGAASGAEGPPRASDDEQQVVCKKVTMTGSRIRKTVCRTKARADEERRGGRRAVEQAGDELQGIQRAMRQGAP